MKKKNRKIIDSLRKPTMAMRPLILVGCLFLAGCGDLVRTTYQQPDVTLTQAWRQQEGDITGTAIAEHENWWRTFDDPVLDRLIDRALRSNNDLAAASLRVRRARLQSDLADTNLTPNVTLGGNAATSKDLNSGRISRNADAAASLSYELDLWGRMASVRDSARWELEATEADRLNTALLLVGTTAKAYWQVAYLNQRITLDKASIAYTRKSLQFAQVRYKAGEASELDVTQAMQSLATQEASMTQLLQQRVEALNELAIIFNRPPEIWPFDEADLPEPRFLPTASPPEVQPGIPAAIIAQRPDLTAAESRLRKLQADVDSTRASFYPTFTLTGNLGSSSTSLTDVLRNPVAALGLGLTLPFIQWNTMELNVEIAEVEYLEAVVNFRQTLYKALVDVENALSARSRYRDEQDYLEQALIAARRSEELAKVRYSAGATGMQAWLDEQERRRNAEASLAQNRLNRFNTQMNLYMALGGDTDKNSLLRLEESP